MKRKLLQGAILIVLALWGGLIVRYFEVRHVWPEAEAASPTGEVQNHFADAAKIVGGNAALDWQAGTPGDPVYNTVMTKSETGYTAVTTITWTVTRTLRANLDKDGFRFELD